MEEEKIECYGVKVYPRPRVFGGNQFIDSRDQAGSQVKLGISWDGSTRHLDVSPLTREDINTLDSLQIICGEPYSIYISFGIYTRQFRFDNPCLVTVRVNITWKKDKIQEWRKRLGCISAQLVKKTYEASTQDYPGVRHKCEVMSKNSDVVIIISLPDPMNDICCNK